MIGQQMRSESLRNTRQPARHPPGREMTEAGNPRNVSYTRTGEKFEVRQSGVRVQNLFIAHIDIAEGKTRFASARCDSLPRPTTFHAAVAVERPFLHTDPSHEPQMRLNGCRDNSTKQRNVSGTVSKEAADA